MYCMKCGKEIREGSAFCHSCGQRVVAVKTPDLPQTGKKPEKKAKRRGISKKIGKIILAAAVVAFVGLGLYAAWSLFVPKADRADGYVYDTSRYYNEDGSLRRDTTYEYDKDFRLTGTKSTIYLSESEKARLEEEGTPYTDPVYETAETFYNEDGKVSEWNMVMESHTGEPMTFHYTYTYGTNRKTEVRGEDDVIEYYYDTEGLEREVDYRFGSTMIRDLFYYDANGNMTERYRAIYKIVDGKEELERGTTNVYIYDFDEQGRKTKRTCVEGDEEGYVEYYDAEGRVTRSVTNVGSYTMYEYDQNGNMIKECYFNSDNELGSYSEHEYRKKK